MSTMPAFEKYPFDIALEEEGEGCVITFPDLPGCMADGTTEEEAIVHAQYAFQAWMASTLEDGKPIPVPHSAVRIESSDALTVELRERIRANIRARGLKFDVFLPDSLAN